MQMQDTVPVVLMNVLVFPRVTYMGDWTYTGIVSFSVTLFYYLCFVSSIFV